MGRISFAKFFPVFQILIGVLFLLQAFNLIIKNRFDLSLGETHALLLLSISCLVWLVAGIVLLSRKKWGWIMALSMYLGCLLYQGWAVWRVMETAPYLERVVYRDLFAAIIFILMVVILFLTRKKFFD